MDNTPKNYEEAKRRYEGRRDKVLGRKIRRDGWMQYDAARDCYVLTEVLSKYAQDEESKTHKRTADKTRWTVKPYAEIHREQIVILREVHNSFLANFGVTHHRARTNKFLGRQWQLLTREKHGWRQLAELVSEAPIVVKDNTLLATNAQKERMVDNELRKEMNRMIQKIRRLLTVRVKLGAFDSLTHKELQQHALRNGYSSKWEILSRPKDFLGLLKAVTEDDIETFYPILWLSVRGWYLPRDSSFTHGRDVVATYNSLIDSMRERIRRELGVVSYVQVADSDASADRTGDEVQTAG